jgi:hypothetical protein
MTELSPAAQAILNAFRAVPNLMDEPSIAGALRAAAPFMEFVQDHLKLIAIADELEGNN